MATLELDPGFIKALRLLHSKAKDSGTQLRIMVDEAIAGKKAHKLKLDTSEPEMFEPKKSKHETSSPSRDEKKEKEREKERQYKKEKEKREQERERERQEREKQKELEREKERAQQEEMESEESTEEYDKSMNADDFALGLGVCCQVCKKFDITPKNRLVECQECHALYHQECHKPPVVGNITDPRFVWYCNKCNKTMKKMSQKQSKPKPAPAPASSKESSSSSSSKSDPLTLAQPFQRTEKKIPSKDSQSSSSSSSSQPFKGLASLAANLTKGSSKAESKALLTGWKTEPVKPGHKDSSSSSDKSSRLDSKSSKESKGEKSGSSASSSSSAAAGSSSGSKSGSGGGGGGSGNGSKQPSMSGSTMATANKRLQLMKKSAAAKQQEKRVHIK